MNLGFEVRDRARHIICDAMRLLTLTETEAEASHGT